MEPGTTIERFEILRALGSGGMATVYAVKHVELGSLHALKVLLVESPELAERLRNEGRLQAGLRHPHIVAVHDVISVEGNPGLVMELVEGMALDEWIEVHPEAEHAIRMDLARQVIAAVAHAHAQGMVHRDLKPANVLVTEVAGRPFAKVADFGLAKHLDDDLSRTRTGMPMGTPRYMAPEQIRDAKRVDERADVFALGCLIHELWTGRPAFEAESIGQVFIDIVAGEIPPLDELPDVVAAAVRGALEPDPDARIASCEGLLAVLEGGAPPPPGPPRPRPAPPAPVVAAKPEVQAEAPPAHAVPERAPEDPQQPARRGRWLAAGAASGFAGIALLVLLLGCGGLAIWQWTASPAQERPSAPSPTPSPDPTPRTRPIAPMPSPTPAPAPSPRPSPDPSPKPKPDKPKPDKGKGHGKDKD